MRVLSGFQNRDPAMLWVAILARDTGLAYAPATLHFGFTGVPSG